MQVKVLCSFSFLFFLFWNFQLACPDCPNCFCWELAKNARWISAARRPARFSHYSIYLCSFDVNVTAILHCCRVGAMPCSVLIGFNSIDWRLMRTTGPRLCSWSCRVVWLLSVTWQRQLIDGPTASRVDCSIFVSTFLSLLLFSRFLSLFSILCLCQVHRHVPLVVRRVGLSLSLSPASTARCPKS